MKDGFCLFFSLKMYVLGIVLTVEKQGRKESEKHFRCKVAENSRWSLFYNVRKNMYRETRTFQEKAQII